MNNWLHASAIHQRRLTVQENMHGNHVLAFFINHALHAKTEWNRQPHHWRVGDVVQCHGHLDRMTGSAVASSAPFPLDGGGTV